LALGIISSRAKHVSDEMIKASALALAKLSPTRQDKRANLLPPLASIRSVSLDVAKPWESRPYEMDWLPSMRPVSRRNSRPTFGHRYISLTNAPIE
jgi:hypothetical protein